MAPNTGNFDNQGKESGHHGHDPHFVVFDHATHGTKWHARQTCNWAQGVSFWLVSQES